MSDIVYFLQKDNKFLDQTDAFKVGAFREPEAKSFETEAAALDKAEALGLNLDRIRVVKAKKKEAPVKEPPKT